MAITGLAIAVPSSFVRSSTYPKHLAQRSTKSLIAGFVVCAGTVVVAGSVWFAARPHKDSTMRRLRRIALIALVSGVCMGILFILTS